MSLILYSSAVDHIRKYKNLSASHHSAVHRKAVRSRERKFRRVMRIVHWRTANYLPSWPNLPLQILNFDASKHPLVFATESYPKENGHANCPRDPIMNLIESRRNRGDGRKVSLGRIIDMVAPIRRHFLSLLLEGHRAGLGLPD